jgi:NAD(P)-dependent dehydrogenase (short-subunit alcohol dehydrogenase family)
LGLETCRALVAHGGHVIGTCREEKKCKDTTEAIEKEFSKSGGKFETLVMDLNSLKSVKEAADAFRAKKLPLHGLICNAGKEKLFFVVCMCVLFAPSRSSFPCRFSTSLSSGVMACPYALTEEKLESQFGVNHMAHFLLVTRLLDILKVSSLFLLPRPPSLPRSPFISIMCVAPAFSLSPRVSYISPPPSSSPLIRRLLLLLVSPFSRLMLT